MRRSLFSLGVLCLASIGLAQETGYNTNWSGHRTLHVNTLALSQTGTQISANVLKYPMLVRLGQADSAIFSAAKTDGADVRFTKSNNTTRLQHSIETWDAANRIAAVWVLLDTVYANNQTQNFRMHWGNAGAADSSKPGAVFDSANGFEAVWHMGNASGAAARPNAVLGGNPATPAGSATASLNPTRGIIGMADSLRSANNNTSNDDHFTVGSGYRFAQGEGTMSLWTKFLATGSWNNMISLSNGNGIGGGQTQGGMANNIWFGRENNTNNLITRSSIKMPAGNGFFPADTGMEGTARVVPGALSPNGVWAHFTLTFSDSGRRRTLYKDGALLADFPALTPGTRANDSINLRNTVRNVERTQTFIGRSQWGDRNYRGAVDEVRISKVARSADWILLDYASQKEGQALVTDSVAPMIAYGTDSIIAEVGFPIQAQLPVVFTGVPQPTVAISPALPNGLSLTTGNNANRGLISGTPTAAATTTMHVITATNGKGVARDTIYVRVNANNENYSTWSNTRTLTFNSPASATLTRFPFLVRLGAADSAVFSQAGANGASLRFSRTDAIKLKYSIDHWDATARRAAVWVLMDQVVPGANTLRMHWGNGSATNASSPSAVFEATNGYTSVWHLGNAADTTPRPNSVAGGNTATPQNMPAGYAPVVGAIGMADTLGGGGNRDVGQWINLGTGYSNWGGKMTMSAWIKPEAPDLGAWNQFISLSNGTNATPGRDNIWMGRQGGNTNFTTELFSGTAGGGHTHANNVQVMGEWAHLAWTVANGNQVTLYRNGVRVATRTSNQPIKDTVRTANHIGRAPWPDPTVRGVFDEVRFSNVTRDSNWLKLEYASQRPGAMPLGTLTYPTISGAPGSPITPASPSVSALSYSYTGTLPAGLTFNENTGVISGTPTGAGKATLTVTASNGVWSTSGTVSMSFGAADGPYATAWTGHQWVSINAGDAPVGVNDTLRNFPILVRLGSADAAIFAASQKTGADIRFTKLNDVTRLKHEIDHWDSAGRSAAIWVLVDTVYGRTNGSRLRMHYGNLSVADSSQPSAVFDTANGYLGVWHMGNVASNTAPRPNAVAGGFPATPAASTANLNSGFAPRTGIIGMADSLRGQNSGTNNTAKSNDDHFNLGNSGYVFTGGQVTISMWLKLNDPIGSTNYHHFITFGNGTNNADNIWMGRIGNTNTFGQRSATSDGESQTMEVEEALAPLGQWANFTITRTGSNGTTATSYKNGAPIFGPETTDGTINAVSRAQNYIGRSIWGDPNVRMMVDEVRVLKVARPAGWVKLEYHNQVPTGTAVVRTTSQVAITVNPVGVNQASLLAGEALSFKAVNNGLLFQIQGEAAARAKLAIVDMQGRVVWSRNVNPGAGMTQVFWNGASNKGQEVGAGVYVVRMSLLDDAGKTTHRLDKKVPLAR